MLDYSIRLNSGIEIVLDSYFKASSKARLLSGELSRDQELDLYTRNIHHFKSRLWPEDNLYDIYSSDTYPQVSGGRIPSVITLAKFIHPNPVRDEDRMASSLVIAWPGETRECFSDEIGIKLIKTIDWKRVAGDFDW